VAKRGFRVHLHPKSRKSIIAFFLSILGAVPIALVLDLLGTFNAIEPRLAPLFALRAAPKDPHVVVVSISDGDFRERFDSNRPFAPDKLISAIETIAKGKPNVIGVDIDTSSPNFEEVAHYNFTCPVLWARTAHYSYRMNFYYSGKVLGGSQPPPPLSGVVEFETDPDGILRRYQRSFPISRPSPNVEDANKGRLWMFSAALAAIGAQKNSAALDALKNPPDSDELFINFFPRNRSGHADVVRRTYGDLLAPNAVVEDAVKNKIVILGGEFQGEDEHQTPMGWMSGLEILAQIAETDASNTSKPASPVQLVAVTAAILAMAGLVFVIEFRVAVFVGALALLTSFLAGVLLHSVRQTLYWSTVCVVILIAKFFRKYIQNRQTEQEKLQPKHSPCS
jgi:CHASE2 domain-containing sensor protein